MEDTPRTPTLMTVHEVANALRVHTRTVYRLISNGSIRAVKIGRQWRVPQEAFLEFIDSGWKAVVKVKKKPDGPVQLNLPLDGE